MRDEDEEEDDGIWLAPGRAISDNGGGDVELEEP